MIWDWNYEQTSNALHPFFAQIKAQQILNFQSTLTASLIILMRIWFFEGQYCQFISFWKSQCIHRLCHFHSYFTSKLIGASVANRRLQNRMLFFISPINLPYKSNFIIIIGLKLIWLIDEKSHVFITALWTRAYRAHCLYCWKWMLIRAWHLILIMKLSAKANNYNNPLSQFVPNT